MKTPSRWTSRPCHIVCPACGSGELRPRGPQLVAGCDYCDLCVEGAVFRTLEQIAALPDAPGAHPCECGHPEMRLLPDGVFHCPSCGSEVLPIEAASGLENTRVGSAFAQGRGIAPQPGTRPRQQEARGGKKQEEGAREGSKHQGGVLR